MVGKKKRERRKNKRKGKEDRKEMVPGRGCFGDLQKYNVQVLVGCGSNRGSEYETAPCPVEIQHNSCVAIPGKRVVTYQVFLSLLLFLSIKNKISTANENAKIAKAHTKP